MSEAWYKTKTWKDHTGGELQVDVFKDKEAVFRSVGLDPAICLSVAQLAELMTFIKEDV